MPNKDIHKHAKPFTKDDPRINRQGRPKLPNLNEALARYLADEKDGKTALDAVLMKLRQMAISGNLKAAEMLLDRAYGKPKQHTDHTTNGKDLQPQTQFIVSTPELQEDLKDFLDTIKNEANKDLSQDPESLSE